MERNIPLTLRPDTGSVVTTSPAINWQSSKRNSDRGKVNIEKNLWYT